MREMSGVEREKIDSVRRQRQMRIRDMIKHEALNAASATHGYVEREVISTVRSGSLGMAQGDLAHNVDMLVRGDLPATDPPMRQLKALLAAGGLRRLLYTSPTPRDS